MINRYSNYFLLGLFVSLIILLATWLRFYRLTEVPPSPYWEEVALGYDAFSMATTGRDHHGHIWPIVAVESFGDWKPSGYFYAIIPFIKIMGLNVWSVRFPSAISGVLIVIGVGVLINLLLEKTLTDVPLKKIASVLAMGITAISPWAIQFSRAAWEVNFALCLVLWGVALSLIMILQRRKVVWFVLGTFLLIAAMYTYHATRILAPILGLSLVWLWLKKCPGSNLFGKTIFWLRHHFKVIIFCLVTSLLLTSPLILSLGKKETNQRFAETSIFTNSAIIQESNSRKERAHNTILSRLIYHRYVLFAREIVINYAKHFELSYLIIKGDINPRHSIQYIGLIYHFEIFFLLLGIYWFIKNWHPGFFLLVIWLVVGIFPAAITYAAPHALRTLPTLPVWMVLITMGIIELITLLISPIKSLIKILKIKISSTLAVLIISIVIAGSYVVEFGIFWRYYQTAYSLNSEHEWQYGYQQLIEKFVQQQSKHPELTNQYITREAGRPSMYYFFYTQADPKKVQTAAQSSPQDQGELIEYQQIKFPFALNLGVTTPALVASSPEELASYRQLHPEKNIQILAEVDNFNLQPIWLIFGVE